MKALRRTLPTAVLAIILAATGRAQEGVISKQELDAKLAYCKTCHGANGRGYHGAFPIPRLAGQQPEYFENQLHAFIDRRRENKFMYSVAHVLSPAMLPALAAHFRDLNPPPLGGAPKDLIPAGKKIYEEGIASANIPPCASCHGTDARGNGPFPRLAGQLPDYILKKLTNWSQERGQGSPDTSAIMEPIAHSLTEQQIAAVAAYLNYLE